MSCKICNFNQVKDLDRLLLSGVTPASLSQKYRFSVADLERHREHLQQKMALARSRFQVSLHQGLFCKLNTVMEMVLGVIRGAKGSQDARLLLQAGREFTRIINLMHKMAAQLEFDPEFLYCLMASDQWDLQEDALLPYGLQALSRTRQTLKVNLFAPCPARHPRSRHRLKILKSPCCLPTGKISWTTKAQMIFPSSLPFRPGSRVRQRQPANRCGKPARPERDKSATIALC